MNGRSHWTLPQLAVATVILAGFLTALAVNWPGHLSYDSILQLLQGRTARYNSWHPPVMAWLLGLGDSAVPGAGLFVLFDALLAFGALFSLLFLAPVRSGWLGAALAPIIVLSPQLLLYQGIVWKDVLFADAAVSSFVCLGHAVARWPAVRPRVAWLAAGMVLLTLATLARQNGVVLLPFAAAALGWIAARQGLARGKAALFGGAFLIGALTCAFAASTLLSLRSDGEPAAAEQFRLLEVYDLAGAVARDEGVPLTVLDDGESRLKQVIRKQGPRFYTPERNDPLTNAPDVDAAVADADPHVVQAQWKDLIVNHTWLYLKVRAADFAWLVATPPDDACRAVFTGIEGPAKALGLLGMAPRRDGRDLALMAYAKSFLGTPVWSHVTFAIIALACLVLLLRRRRPADIAMAAMLAAAFAFTASFFVISISCDYRYLYALDLSALAALLYLALDFKSALRGTP